MTQESVPPSPISAVLTSASPIRLLAFAIVHIALVGVGFWLRLDVPSATLMWPAQGWLFAALWLSSRTMRLPLLVTALGAEIVGALIFGEHSPTWLATLGIAAYFSIANVVGAAAGVWAAQRLVANPMIARDNPVPAALLGTCIASALAAAVGATGLSRLGAADGRWLDNWQLWFLGDAVGILVVMPVVISWASRLLGITRFQVNITSIEFFAIFAATLTAATAIFVFSSGAEVGLFALPYFVLLPLFWGVLRLPPRYAVLLITLVVGIATIATHYELGPFGDSGSLTLYRLLPLQMFLASLCIGLLLLVQAVNQRHLAEAALQRSEGRYRTYVELSSEPIWRIEMRPAIGVNLPPARQLQLVGERGYFAECSRRLLAIASDGNYESLFARPLREHPWFSLLADHWPAFVRAGYRIEGLDWHTKMPSGSNMGLYVSFVGIIENGELQRIWGVARDITELKETQEALEKERELLQEYAALLVSAEERARRTTAIDLHDGLGQLLIAAKFRLQALKKGPAEPHALASEIEAIDNILEDASASTRGVIADLSPPGLYELGLGPALRWLSGAMEARHGLTTRLTLGPGIENLPEPVRVTAYRVTRELLNNVVRHSTVTTADVAVAADGDHVQLVVEDAGRGFDPHAIGLRDFGPGFGLFSVRDQVRHSGGALSIHSKPGQGTRVTVRLPLNAEQPSRALAS
jgi:signal transduction histidine kinase